MARSSHKKKLEPISIAELEGDSTMVGFTSLFRIPTTQDALPHVAAALEASLQPTVGVSSKPTVGIDTKPTVGIQPTEGSVSKPTEVFAIKPAVGLDAKPTVGVGSKPTVGSGESSSYVSPFFRADDGKLYPHQRVRPLREPRDVLSVIELRVFESLEGLAEAGRKLRIGYDRLADLCSLNEKSVRLLLVRLMDKGFLSVEAPADPERQLGKQYRVHTMEEARRHHLEKGWQWVVRSGNGILIVWPVNA